MENVNITSFPRAVQRSSIQEVISITAIKMQESFGCNCECLSNNKNYKKFKIISTDNSSKSKSVRRNLVGIIATYGT